MGSEKNRSITEDIIGICQVVDAGALHRCLDFKKNKFFLRNL